MTTQTRKLRNSSFQTNFHCLKRLESLVQGTRRCATKFVRRLKWQKSSFTRPLSKPVLSRRRLSRLKIGMASLATRLARFRTTTTDSKLLYASLVWNNRTSCIFSPKSRKMWSWIVCPNPWSTKAGQDCPNVAQSSKNDWASSFFPKHALAWGVLTEVW